jgi:cephalosporin hydroxylase
MIMLEFEQSRWDDGSLVAVERIIMSSSWDSEFDQFRAEFLELQSKDKDFNLISQTWLQGAMDNKFTYQFNWLGIPIIQMPTDILVFQEIIWETKPDLIIETGVARGGSVNFWASMQDMCGIDGHVIGIDIDIREHAREAILNSKYSNKITLIESDSVDESIKGKIEKYTSTYKRVMVILDSNHTHDHVYKELRIYADYVTPGCYLVVLDTMTEFIRKPLDRQWGPGDNPYTAVQEFMKNSGGFTLDEAYEKRSLLTLAPSGFWRKNTTK